MQNLKIQDWFDARADRRDQFLLSSGWAGGRLSPIGEDCAFRRYFRIEKDGRRAVFMEAVPDHEPMATPGHRIGDFIRIGRVLHEAGFHAPDIFAADEENGFLLLEDFGDISFHTALGQGHDEKELYGLATDVLAKLRTDIDAEALSLPSYYESHVHEGRRRIVDWFLPFVKQACNPDGLVESYLAVWDGIERDLPPCPQGFLHIDYHVENLMWLPQGRGVQRCGILDFQGAMFGPLAYDLANLLEDARFAIPVALRTTMLDRYCAAMNEDEKQIFLSWYRVLATQFHCRVAGQFIRLALKDGKDRYLQHLPRVIAYLKDGLEHPVLQPLKQWFEGQGIDFGIAPQIKTSLGAAYIREDAF